MTEREKIIEWCKSYCNNTSLTDSGGFSYAVDQLTEAMGRAGITSESMAGMSQSFGKNEGGFDIHGLLSPYKRFKSL